MNLRCYFEAAIVRSPGVLAVVDGSVCWTYRDLAREVEQVAGGLWSEGLRSGDRVMVLLSNRREDVVIFWACQYLGLVYVPVSHRLSANDIAYCIEDAEPEALFFDEVSEAILERVVKKVVLPERVYAPGDDHGGGYKSLEWLYREGRSVRPPCSEAEDSDIAIMLYSSGVTGAPKGVLRTHLNEVSATMAHIIQNRYVIGESTLAISSFCHTMGMRMLLAMVLLNGKMVLVPDEDMGTQIALLEREKVTCLYAFPGVYGDLLSHEDCVRLSCLKKIAYAGDAMAGELIGRCFAQLELDEFVNHFGSTEIYTYATCSWLSRKPGCVGKAGINAELRVVVPSTTVQASPADRVNQGEVGELVVKLSSPEAFRGYWNRPDLIMRTIRDGWFFTGDLVRVDEEGDFWVIGRVDDMVISRGEKIFPSEVETVLRGCPKVKELSTVLRNRG